MKVVISYGSFTFTMKIIWSLTLSCFLPITCVLTGSFPYSCFRFTTTSPSSLAIPSHCARLASEAIHVSLGSEFKLITLKEFSRSCSGLNHIISSTIRTVNLWLWHLQLYGVTALERRVSLWLFQSLSRWLCFLPVTGFGQVFLSLFLLFSVYTDVIWYLCSREVKYYV